MDDSLNHGYAYAWQYFRQIYSENENLLTILKNTIGIGHPLNNGFTVYDIGCGDGLLSRQILSNDEIFRIDRRPQLYYLLEPLPEFRTGLENTVSLPSIKNNLAPGGDILYRPIELAQLRASHPGQDVPGLVLSIHSSYYLNSEDVAKLQFLKARNYNIMILENHVECWVSKIMSAIGNTEHPQFEQNRFVNLLGNLGYYESPNQISFPLQAPLLRNVQIELMVDFFYCCSTLSLSLDEKIDKLRDAFFVVMNDLPNFVYSYVYIHQTSGMGIDG
jgi:hypothetical protein